MPAQPILFCSHVVELGGAEMVLLDLLQELDRERFAPHLAVPGDGPLASRAAELGVPLHEVPLAGNSKLAKVRAAFRAKKPLRRLADELGCRVLVANSMIAGYAAVMAQRPVLACVWHLHAVVHSKIAAAALRRATAVIAPSRAALDAASLEHGIRIDNGVPDRFFDAGLAPAPDAAIRREHGIPDAAPLLGIVGRLDPHKGHEVLLRSLAALPAGTPEAHLVIAGGELFSEQHARLGGFEAAMRQLCEDLGLAPRVHWLGEVADTASLLPQLDALVVPSTGLESAPRTIAEALAAQCPVVASDIGGIREMLADGEAGVLVPPDQVEALAAALARGLAERETWARTAPGARARAEERFRMAAFARRCEAVFAQANTKARAGKAGGLG